jgi:hypothetical protein
MNRINLIRVVLFICVVVAFTAIVCTVQCRHEEQKLKVAAQVQQQAAEQKAAEATRIKDEQSRQKVLQTAIAEHEKFLTRFTNTNITKRVGSRMVAVAVASETRSMNHAIGTTLVNHFRADHLQLTDSFFKPELVTDGLFNRAFNGESDLFNKLELAKSLDGILLARQEVQYETNADLNNVVTVAMQLEIVTLPVAGQSESHSWTFTANGAGIRRTDARTQAEERIINQIEKDTKMSLTTNP